MMRAYLRHRVWSSELPGTRAPEVYPSSPAFTPLGDCVLLLFFNIKCSMWWIVFFTSSSLLPEVKGFFFFLNLDDCYKLNSTLHFKNKPSLRRKSNDNLLTYKYKRNVCSLLKQ